MFVVPVAADALGVNLFIYTHNSIKTNLLLYPYKKGSQIDIYLKYDRLGGSYHGCDHYSPLVLLLGTVIDIAQSTPTLTVLTSVGMSMSGSISASTVSTPMQLSLQHTPMSTDANEENMWTIPPSISSVLLNTHPLSSLYEGSANRRLPSSSSIPALNHPIRSQPPSRSSDSTTTATHTNNPSGCLQPTPARSADSISTATHTNHPSHHLQPTPAKYSDSVTTATHTNHPSYRLHPTHTSHTPTPSNFLPSTQSIVRSTFPLPVSAQDIAGPSSSAPSPDCSTPISSTSHKMNTLASASHQTSALQSLEFGSSRNVSSINNTASSQQSSQNLPDKNINEERIFNDIIQGCADDAQDFYFDEFGAHLDGTLAKKAPLERPPAPVTVTSADIMSLENFMGPDRDPVFVPSQEDSDVPLEPSSQGDIMVDEDTETISEIPEEFQVKGRPKGQKWSRTSVNLSGFANTALEMVDRIPWDVDGQHQFRLFCEPDDWIDR